jgi:serine/threonine-protein kinase
MTEHIIKLPAGEWLFDDSQPLGAEGGFGEVFAGAGKLGQVAVKRLKISATQAAHRELKIGNELMRRDLIHIVPVLDAGQDAESDRYFLIMPRCECSLQDKINLSRDGLDFQLIQKVLKEIVSGLQEVHDITHRDLKPSNVLFHKGVWKIADFGIAKFVEDSTSLETLRSALTPLYAAPEQWRGERSTTATDIYALGCIVHAIATGHPPFGGTMDQVREQHLHIAPPQIDRLPPRIAAFVSQMLRKPPDARPTLSRCNQVFSEIEIEQKKAHPSQQAFAEAAKKVAAREAEEEAKRSSEADILKKRQALFADAARELTAIRERLFSYVKHLSDSVTILNKHQLQFGFGTTSLDDSKPINEQSISLRTRRKAYVSSGWSVIGWARISTSCNPKNRIYSWSASLLYADRNDGNGYRWYEVAFWSFSGGPSGGQPYAIDGDDQDVDLALSNVMHSVNLAYGPYPISGEDEHDFQNRWIGLIAKAATGDLRQPNMMPIEKWPE